MRIENHHNVYVIGAGFSADANYPVLADFLRTMRDAQEWLATNGRGEEATAIERVLKFRLESSAAAYRVHLDLENIEDLFSLAAASSAPIENDIKRSIAATLDFVRTAKKPAPYLVHLKKGHLRLPEHRRYKAAHGSGGEALDSFVMTPHEFVLLVLSGIMAGGATRRNTFISMNYDSLFEDSCRGIGIPFSYGLTGEETAVCVDRVTEPHVSPLVLLKLHGSINWARAKEQDSLQVFPSYSGVLEVGLVPEVVPPTWQKSFSRELEIVWMKAVEALESATRIIIIGFSFPSTDAHFRYLLGAGLQKNISLRDLVVFDKNAEPIKPRVRSLIRDDLRLTSDSNFISASVGEIARIGSLALERMDRGTNDGLRSWNVAPPDAQLPD